MLGIQIYNPDASQRYGLVLNPNLQMRRSPFNETRRYTKRVLASRAAYAFLYESQIADEAIALPIKIGG